MLFLFSPAMPTTSKPNQVSGFLNPVVACNILSSDILYLICYVVHYLLVAYDILSSDILYLICYVVHYLLVACNILSSDILYVMLYIILSLPTLAGRWSDTTVFNQAMY